MDRPEVVDLLAGTLRVPVEREVALAIFARSAMLLDQHRVETVQVPVHADPPSIVHLLLGAIPITVVEGGVTGDPSKAIAGIEPMTFRDPIPGDSITPDFDAYDTAEEPSVR